MPIGRADRRHGGAGKIGVDSRAGAGAAGRCDHDIYDTDGMRRRRGGDRGGVDDGDACGGNAADGDRGGAGQSWCR